MPEEDREPDQDCDDCTFFLSGTDRCVLHGLDDVISPEGWCKHLRMGMVCTLESLGFTPTGATTKKQSQYQEEAHEEGPTSEADSYESHKKMRKRKKAKV